MEFLVQGTTLVLACLEIWQLQRDELKRGPSADEFVGTARDEAVALAHRLAKFPQRCLRSDRLSSYRQWDLPLHDALVEETRLGLEVVRSGETREGASRFASGAGRHGSFD